MLNLELVSTAEDEAAREHEGEMNHGSAVLRRLVDPWKGSNLIVCADSYFASVEASELLLEIGASFRWCC